MFLEEFGGGAAAQDFAMHVVEVAGGGITTPLRYSSHALALGEITANEAVAVFVGATFTGCVGVTVVKGGDKRLNAVSVLKLRAVVNGEGTAFYTGAL